MPAILSTKKLSLSQKQLILNSGISFVEYDAIKIDFLSFHPQNIQHKNLIFTSKNAVRAVAKTCNLKALPVDGVFCVGEKTKELLESYGVDVLETRNYGAQLAKVIKQDYRDRSFTYFCGNIRRDELPDALRKTDPDFQEVEVYSTSLNRKSFGRGFDAVLFFSPSGVDSYCEANTPGNSTFICIGTTTAAEARKFSEKIKIATKPTIENVIVQAVKLFGKSATGAH